MISGRLFRHSSRFMLRISWTFEVHRLLLELFVVVVLLEGLAVIAAIAALTALAEPAALVALPGFAVLEPCCPLRGIISSCPGEKVLGALLSTLYRSVWTRLRTFRRWIWAE
jgi:hypothetical protein